MRRPVNLRAKSMGSINSCRFTEPNLPPALFFHHQPERLGRGPMAATRIKEHKIDVYHGLTFS